MRLSETAPAAGSVRPTHRDNMAKTAGYYLSFIGLGLTAASLGPTLPGLAGQTGSHLSEISFLFTGRSLGYLIGTWFGGRFFDRVPGHPVIFAVLATLALTLAVVPLLPSLWLLTAVILVIGLAEGGLDVGGNTLLVWVHRHRVGPYMNGLHFFFGLGAFVSPIIVAQAILHTGGIAWAYWMLALLILPIAFYVLRLPSPAAQTAAKDDPSGRVNRLLVALIILFLFAYTGAEVAMGGWIFTYALARGMPEATSAYLTSAFWGALTLGRLLAIPIAIRLRPRYILLTNLVGCLVSLSFILIWPGSQLALWIGVLGTGLFMSAIFPTTLSLAERRMTITGRINSWFFTGASIGSMSLPWLIGQLFDVIGPGTVIWIVFADLSLALVIFFLLIARSARVVEKAVQD